MSKWRLLSRQTDDCFNLSLNDFLIETFNDLIIHRACWDFDDYVIKISSECRIVEIILLFCSNVDLFVNKLNRIELSKIDAFKSALRRRKSEESREFIEWSFVALTFAYEVRINRDVSSKIYCANESTDKNRIMYSTVCFNVVDVCTLLFAKLVACRNHMRTCSYEARCVCNQMINTDCNFRRTIYVVLTLFVSAIDLRESIVRYTLCYERVSKTLLQKREKHVIRILTLANFTQDISIFICKSFLSSFRILV